MADSDLASDLQNGGFAKLGQAADPQKAGQAVSDTIGKIGKGIQDFYKKSIGANKDYKKATPKSQDDYSGAYGRTGK
jgi:hypothetical protein